jgi:hypothetical protein
MLNHLIIIKITIILISAPSNCKFSMGTRVCMRRQKWLRNLQPIIRIPGLLKFTALNDNNVWKININFNKFF